MRKLEDEFPTKDFLWLRFFDISGRMIALGDEEQRSRGFQCPIRRITGRDKAA